MIQNEQFQYQKKDITEDGRRTTQELIKEQLNKKRKETDSELYNTTEKNYH